MTKIHMLYYIIRAANRNNGNFNLLTTNKNYQRHTRSNNVICNNKRVRAEVLTNLLPPLYMGLVFSIVQPFSQFLPA